MSLVEQVELQHIDQSTGSIVVAEGERNVPFAIRRVYFLYGVPASQQRGGHAHKQLAQVALCVHGSCRFRLTDGTRSEEIVLATPHVGIIIRAMIWREMYEFSPDCVLLVLASEHYDESDYIRDYDDFKRAVGGAE